MEAVLRIAGCLAAVLASVDETSEEAPSHEQIPFTASSRQSGPLLKTTRMDVDFDCLGSNASPLPNKVV